MGGPRAAYGYRVGLRAVGVVAYKSLLNVSGRAPNRLNRSLIYTKWRQSLDETLGSTPPLLRTIPPP